MIALGMPEILFLAEPLLFGLMVAVAVVVAIVLYRKAKKDQDTGA